VILILTAAFLRVKPKESQARISFFGSTKGEHHLKQLNAWEQFRVMYSEWKDKKTINRDFKNQVKGLAICCFYCKKRHPCCIRAKLYTRYKEVDWE
jgi:hypothetical protein